MRKNKLLKFTLVSLFFGLFLITVSFQNCAKKNTEEENSSLDEDDSLLILGVNFVLHPMDTGNHSPDKLDIGSCNITDQDTQSIKRCHLAANEDILNKSELQINIEGNTPDCYRVTAWPKYHRLSTSPVFNYPYDSDNTLYNCEESDTNPVPSPKCFLGPAVEALGSEFPVKTGLFHIINGMVNFKISERFKSAFEMNANNTYIANDLDDAKRSENHIDVENGIYYVANTMHDYQISCVDTAAQLKYQITVILHELNSTTNEIPDWGIINSQE